MERTLVLEIPEEVYQPLMQKAQQVGQTPENVVLQWLTNALRPVNDDPLLQLAGTFASDIKNVSEKHDDYIGQGLIR
ncbi:MAG: hypothetical protein ALAOOOJD_04840 [bacterium]|nr:hypothetical protein [bacterium]